MADRPRRPGLRGASRAFAGHRVLAATLFLGASVGVAWAAGFEPVRHAGLHPVDPWLAAALVGLPISYAGYVGAYRAIAAVERPLQVGWWKATGLVLVGFGLATPRGGFALDVGALGQAGAHERDARIRVLGLGALEYAILAPATAAAGLYLLLRGSPVSVGLTLPWIVCVPLGFVVAFALLRHRHRLRDGGPIARGVAHALDAVALLRAVATMRARVALAAFAGMTLYWAGDLLLLWAALSAFLGHHPSLARLLVGYATGYALTRRTLPFAGAGAVEALLPFALAWVLFPLAPALLAVSAYRLVNLWLAAFLARIARARLDAGVPVQPPAIR